MIKRRRSTPRRRPRRSTVTSPRPSCTTSAATSRCRPTTAPSMIGGAVENPLTLTLDDLRAMPAVEHAVTLECAGNGRLDMRPLPTGEPWGDYAVSTARWRARCLHDVLARAQPAADGVEVRFEGADHGRTTSAGPPRDRPGQPHLRPLAAAGARGRSGRRDPHRLRDERRAAAARPRRPVPADRAALVRRRVGEVAEAARRAHRAVHRRVPDRPLHLPVARPSARAGHADAGPRPDHRPGARLDLAAGTLHGPREGMVRHRPRHRGRGQPHRRGRLAPGASSSRPTAPTNGRTGRFTWEPPTSAGTPSAPGRPTPPATSNPTFRRGTASATGTTPSRSSYVDVR